MIKKSISSFLAIIVIFSLSIIAANANEKPIPEFELKSDKVLVVNLNTDEVVFSKNADKTCMPGSTTKIMTYLVVTDKVNDLSEEVTILQQPIDDLKDSGASMAGFENRIGEKFTVDLLLKGLLIPSGCDAAQELAYYVSGNTTDFVKLMNEKAKELGCKNTEFSNPSGLAEQEYKTTAEDMYLIVKEAMKQQKFREIISTEYCYEFDKDEPWINTNKLIDETNGITLYNPYATGIKTGTENNKTHLIASAKKGKEEFIVICFDVDVTDQYYNYSLAARDANRLIKWTFDNFTENINVELPNRYHSMEIGETYQIESIVKGEGLFTFSSSDDSIASVNENGLVTAKKLGQARITMTSKTGNLDYCYISVGFYNGLDINENMKSFDMETYQTNQVNWEGIKKEGLDYTTIRIAKSDDKCDEYIVDKEMLYNVENALKNNMKVMLSYHSFESEEGDGKIEAKYVCDILNNNLSKYKNQLKLPIIYDMCNDDIGEQDINLNTQNALDFAKCIKDNLELNTIVYAENWQWPSIDTHILRENGVNIYGCKCPYEANKAEITILKDGTKPLMWEFRNDGIYKEAIKFSGDEFIGSTDSLTYMSSVLYDSFEQLKLNSSDTDLNRITLSFTNKDYVASSYEILQKSENDDNYKVIAKLKTTDRTFSNRYDEGGTFSYKLRTTVSDLLYPEKTKSYDSEEIKEIYIYSRFDTNRDKRNSIDDATELQMYLAHLKTEDDNFSYVGDVDNNNIVNIVDVTRIQQHLVNLY